MQACMYTSCVLAASTTAIRCRSATGNSSFATRQHLCSLKNANVHVLPMLTFTIAHHSLCARVYGAGLLLMHRNCFCDVISRKHRKQLAIIVSDVLQDVRMRDT